MTETQLLLNDEEKRLLVDLLTSALNQRLVEEHRTRTPVYREHITHAETVIESILTKLDAAPLAMQ